ncbi:hypothetical protein AMTRI_Chr07g76200 [Amborella trichopoda]
MAPVKFHMALEAMGNIGIPPKAVTPVLKNLLKLYDDNWELIEEENYRVLADAIFEAQETKKQERKRKAEKIDREDDRNKEIERDETIPTPRTRSRLRIEEPSSPFLRTEEPVASPLRLEKPPAACTTHSGFGVGESSSKEPKRVPSACPASGERTWKLIKSEEPDLPCTNLGQEKAANEAVPSTKRCLKMPKIEPGIEPLPDASNAREPYDDGPIPLDKRSPAKLKSPCDRYMHSEKQKDRVDHDNMPNHHSKSPCQLNTEELPSCFQQVEFEVPIAVIPPLFSNVSNVPKEGPSSRYDSFENTSVPNSPSANYKDQVGEEDVPPSSSGPCRNSNRLELVSVPEATANYEIASSSSGEVKLSLSCNSAHGSPDFHVPSLEAVLKLAEDRALKTYRILDPSFSIMKLMKDMCQCFLELSTGSTSGDEETHVNPTPNINLFSSNNQDHGLDAKGVFASGNGVPVTSKDLALNHAQSFRLSVDEKFLQFPRQINLHGMDGLCRNERAKTNDKGKKKKELGPDPNSRMLVVSSQAQLSMDEARIVHCVNDISKGEESVRISVVNEVSSERYPPSFQYIPKNIVYQNAYVNFSLARIGDEDCCPECFGDCLSSSLSCACARETGGEYAYTLDGLLKKEFLDQALSMNRDPEKHHHFYCKDCPLERSRNENKPDACKGHLVRKFIKECWSKCGCSRQCGNRVVQRGIQCNLQVFFTSEGKGWGLRTLEELPRGTFVCEYVGEVLTNTELYNRNAQGNGDERHTYPVLLDADWCTEGVLKDEEALCLDATHFGNVGRFVNHRCGDANLVEIPVEIETPDHHYYHLAFFTTRKVEALDELTWDYGIDFEDHDHPVKAFKCLCGSKLCRGIGQRSRTKVRPLTVDGSYRT